MSWVRTIVREIFGLFVDDGNFAFLILVWLGLTAFGLPRLEWMPRWRGVIMFAGLALILIGSATRYSRSARS
jgi:hypothetical protein